MSEQAIKKAIRHFPDQHHRLLHEQFLCNRALAKCVANTYRKNIHDYFKISAQWKNLEIGRG
jgi:hypothetical protein